MQADQNNYQPDPQFTDKGWNEMLKTLDKEMPVQEQKRRGFFWLFPFLLIGVIASVWAFYPKNETAQMAQRQEVIYNQNQANNQNQKANLPLQETGQYQNSSNIPDSNFDIKNKNIVTENKTTETFNQKSNNSKVEIDDNFPSIIDSSNPLSPQVNEEVLPLEKTKIIEQKDPLAKLEKEVPVINSSFITIELQKEKELEIVEKEFFFEEKIIIETPKLADRKTEFGVFAGVVGDFANIKKIGLTSGGYVHFPMGKKLGLRTGLGYSQLQKELPYTFVGNQDAALSSEFLDASIASPPPFSRVAVQANSDFMLEKFHQLDLPVLITYSPVKKIQFQLGANFSYLIKDKIKLVNNDLDINYSANSDYSNYGIELDVLDLNSISPNQYSDENYWTKLNVSAVAGLTWKPTKKINLGLQYYHGLLPILKSNKSSSSSLIQGASTQRYEVYNNSGDFYPTSGTVSNGRIEKIFQKERFTKYNHSLRFTIGYNF